jgi:hypothetical protein
MENGKASRDYYWLQAPREEVGQLAMERRRAYQEYLVASGRLAQLKELYGSYHGYASDRSSDKLTASGEQGELTLAKINEFRSVLQNLHTLVTSDRPAVFCRAASNDSASLEQSMLGNSIMEDFMKTHGLDAQFRYACETALSVRKAFLMLDWDFHAGEVDAVEELQREDGTPYTNTIRQGKPVFAVKDLTDVAFDPNLATFDEMPWFQASFLVNKWDLVAQFQNDPELQKKITSTEFDKLAEVQYHLTTEDALLSFPSDLIRIWKVYGAKSPAKEEGRFFTCLEDGTVLFDSDLPFDEIPAIPCDPAYELKKKFGHTPAIDMLGLQDGIDGLLSSILTSAFTYASNPLWNKKGQNIDYTELPSGQVVIESDSKPESIVLNTLPPHMVELVKLLEGLMEKVANLNSTARGVPPSANMSGASMALLQSIAIKLSSGLQASYIQMIERTCNQLLAMLKKFATSERVIDAAGVGNRSVVKRWSADNIAKVRRVTVEVGSPLAQTVSGRLEIVRDLMKMNSIKTPQDYFAVLSTGRLEAATDPMEKQIALVAAENEMIARGEIPEVLPGDDPAYHLQHHAAAVADVDARRDPKVLRAYREHFLKHIMDAKTMDPLVAVLFKMDLPPQLIGQPALPPGPPAGGDASAVTNPTPAVEKAAEKVAQPKPPINPASGERWDPATGGLPKAA